MLDRLRGKMMNRVAVRTSAVWIVLALFIVEGTFGATAEDAVPVTTGKTETGLDAWARLVGNTIIVKTRTDSYTEYLAPDGIIRHVDADGATTGRWTATGASVCLDYPDDDERSCGTFEVTDAAGVFVAENGARLPFTILPGNAKNL